MTRSYHASSVLTLLVLLISLSFIPLSLPSAISALGDAHNRHKDNLPGLPVSENMGVRLERIPAAPQNQDEEEEELFKDVDPKRLAAVLLGALNHSHPLQVRGRDEEDQGESKEEIKAERGKVEKEEAYQGTPARERGGRQELEMWIASQGKERERDQEEEREKALEEEEKMTEKVTSHTTSHVVQISTEQQPIDGTTESDGSFQQGSSNPKQGSNQEEEQLNSEELKSLETVMKEFPRLNTRRGEASEQQQRESRAFSSYNDVTVGHKGSDLALSKKKLKWQEETQKALHFPMFTGDNSIDKSMDGVYFSKAAHSTSPEQEVIAEDGSEEEEEVLSPEEEEAQAKVEQEEMMRQAAEAQRAKMEEEKLADIASDMLLRYMVKQDNGNKKYVSSMSNAAEDKRSNEELDVTEKDDIDPQTIDKLIEISSKLHLPADDVVDIITDVEKKKKKDMPPEMASLLPNRPSPPSSSLLPGWQTLNNKNSLTVSKHPSPAVNLLKTWFHEKKPSISDGLQTKLSKPSLAYHSFWPNSEKSFKQDHWFKSPKSLWAAYPYHPYTYSSYYQKKPFYDYYPFYFHPLSRPRPYYYTSKPAFTINNFPGNSIDDSYTFPPKRRYHSWVQSQLRKPPSQLQQKPYITSYHPPIYPRPFQQVSIPKVHPSSQTAPSPSQFYTAGLGTEGTKNQDYFEFGKSDSSIHNDLEKYVQQILINRLQMMD